MVDDLSYCVHYDIIVMTKLQQRHTKHAIVCQILGIYCNFQLRNGVPEACIKGRDK